MYPTSHFTATWRKEKEQETSKDPELSEGRQRWDQGLEELRSMGLAQTTRTEEHP